MQALAKRPCSRLLQRDRGLAAVGERQAGAGEVQDEGDRRVGAGVLVAEQAARARRRPARGRRRHPTGPGCCSARRAAAALERMSSSKAKAISATRGDSGFVVDPLAVVEACSPDLAERQPREQMILADDAERCGLGRFALRLHGARAADRAGPGRAPSSPTRSSRLARASPSSARIAFCLAVPVRPRNCATSSRTVRIRPPGDRRGCMARDQALEPLEVVPCAGTGSHGRHRFQAVLVGSQRLRVRTTRAVSWRCGLKRRTL